jgi:hypothetical protein
MLVATLSIESLDDHLLIRPPAPNKVRDWSNIRSWIAIVLSVVAGGGAIWQGIEARKTRLQMISTFQMEERPSLETTDTHLIQGRLVIMLHNRGKDSRLRCQLILFGVQG